MSPPIRCVLDTNVLVSAGISPNGLARRIRDFVLDTGELITSHSILNEYVDVMARPKFDRYLSLETRIQLLSALYASATIVTPARALSECSDPDDDRVLEAAVEAGVDYLVTGNRRDFPNLSRVFRS